MQPLTLRDRDRKLANGVLLYPWLGNSSIGKGDPISDIADCANGLDAEERVQRSASRSDAGKNQFTKNLAMLMTSTAPAPSILFSQSATQLGCIRQWLLNVTIAFATLAGSALAPASVSAQQAEQSRQSGLRIALIDVAYIFKNLPAIKAHASKIDADSRKEELEIKQGRDALQQAVMRLKTLKVGSADYSRQEEYVAKLDLRSRLRGCHNDRGLNEAEVRLYHESYQQIVSAAQAIATENDIHLILNFSREELDLQRVDSIHRGVRKQVVFHDSALDLTDSVMRYLEQQAGTPEDVTSGNTSTDTSR